MHQADIVLPEPSAARTLCSNIATSISPARGATHVDHTLQDDDERGRGCIVEAGANTLCQWLMAERQSPMEQDGESKRRR